MTATPPRPPTGLRPAGRRLWKAVTSSYELEVHELEVLAMACQQADVVEGLESLVAVDGYMAIGSKGQTIVHPALSEARQGRVVLGRLIAQLALPADAADVPASVRSERARRAADARWRRRDQLAQRRARAWGGEADGDAAS